MSPEQVSSKTSPIERLMALVYEKHGVDIYSRDRDIKIPLNDSEELDIEVFGTGNERDLVVCTAVRKGKVVLDFSIGKNGLEHLGSRVLNLSFGDSKSVTVGPTLGVGYRGSNYILNVSDGEERDFADLAENLVEWTEKTVKEGKIGEIPFKISVDPEAK